MERKNYIIEMQIARGIGILLVTIGHSEPIYEVFPSIFNFIYSFHMPLFFFLSGFFASKTTFIPSYSQWFNTTLPKTFIFIISYLTISIIYAIIKFFLPGLVIRPVVPSEIIINILLYPGKNPALFLWFLYTIIIIRLTLPFLIKINNIALLLLALIFNVISFDIHIFGLGSFLHYLIYYLLGLQLYLIKTHFLTYIKTKKILISGIIAFITCYVLSQYITFPGIKFLIAISGIFSVLSFCFVYVEVLPKKLLEKLGEYSLQIYMLQYFFIFPISYFLKKMSFSGEFIVFASFLIGLAGPFVIVSYLMPKSKILALLLGAKK